jgi:hypothetical protein
MANGLIIYGGSERQVRQQLGCDHDWHGPCMDNISRYYKCKKCFCLERDVETEEQYYQQVKEARPQIWAVGVADRT